jgi:succinate dehydrogenase/fumarate reductase flavoprotein subunit
MIDKRTIDFGGLELPVYSLNTVIVGTGAAGLACAARLFREMEETGIAEPCDEVAIVTEGVGLGTSHNSGSDKQTYYRLGTHGSNPDAPIDFAKTLTAGGCTHGDLALIEAENSLRAFYHLVDAGVPFPHNARGGFVGYKTDHDPSQRATSAGPWTSRFMVRKLLAEVQRYGVRVFDRFHVLSVVTAEEDGRHRACGLVCADMRREDAGGSGLVLFNCRNVVMAGGGPGELYAISVYPRGQMGPYAAMLEAGAAAQNLTESQFGLASVAPRWNLSGTYQQVIPRYFSTDAGGGDVQEFLNPWFDSMDALATDIFLKGYQWPFDYSRIENHGSSLIDVLVQNEMVNCGRRVFMDFTHNPVPTGALGEIDPARLGDEARVYLEKSGAVQATPIERLAHMNQPSIDLYTQMGVDLWKEPLEVGVCNQHCNGGFAVDWWWESSVDNLFVIGELAGTHGVKRPGGSALNAGQVGALRAAQRIAHVYFDRGLCAEDFGRAAASHVKRLAQGFSRIARAGDSALDCSHVRAEIQQRMSRYAGVVRSLDGVGDALSEARAQWRRLQEDGLRQAGQGALDAVRVRELALAQIAFLEAVKAMLERGGGSRGSRLVTDPEGTLPHPDLDEGWRFRPENVALRDEILQVSYDASSDAIATTTLRPRPFPEGEFWFENTWGEFRDATIFRRDDSEPTRPYDIYRRKD